MDLKKTGRALKALRTAKGMTQKELSEKLGVEAKTVSKWETGAGFPDVSLIPALSAELSVTENSLFSGELSPSHENEDHDLKFYFCPSCKSFYLGFGNAEFSCCHKRLSPLEAKEGSKSDLKSHIRDRDHYILYTVSALPDSVTVRRFSPGEVPEISDDGRFFYLCAKDSLYELKREKGAKKEEGKPNMTALISAFSRAYCQNEGVFSDPYARALFSDKEFAALKGYMPDEDYILNNLAPNPLFRARLFADSLKGEIMTGTRQIVILGSGLDLSSLSLGNENVSVFELDKKEVLEDKLRRLEAAKLTVPENVTFVPADAADLSSALKSAGFDSAKKTLFSCLGLFYYFTKEELSALFSSVSELAADKSSVMFDFPDSHFFSSSDPRVKETLALAESSGNPMKCALSYFELEKLLSDSGFLIYEFLTPDEINARCFENTRLRAIPHINFCRAVLNKR